MKPSPTVKRNGGSTFLTNMPAQDNLNTNFSKAGPTKLNVPDVSSSVMMTPAYGSEIGGSSTFSPSFFNTGSTNHSLRQKSQVNNFGKIPPLKSIPSTNTRLSSDGLPKVGQLLSGSVMDILKGNSFAP